MPIYIFKCTNCGNEDEALLSSVVETLCCSKCRGMAVRMPTFPSMVKIKGEGGYPSRRKLVKDTAPYTS